MFGFSTKDVRFCIENVWLCISLEIKAEGGEVGCLCSWWQIACETEGTIYAKCKCLKFLMFNEIKLGWGCLCSYWVGRAAAAAAAALRLCTRKQSVRNAPEMNSKCDKCTSLQVYSRVQWSCAAVRYPLDVSNPRPCYTHNLSVRGHPWKSLLRISIEMAAF